MNLAAVLILILPLLWAPGLIPAAEAANPRWLSGLPERPRLEHADR